MRPAKTKPFMQVRITHSFRVVGTKKDTVIEEVERYIKKLQKEGFEVSSWHVELEGGCIVLEEE